MTDSRRWRWPWMMMMQRPVFFFLVVIIGDTLEGEGVDACTPSWLGLEMRGVQCLSWVFFSRKGWSSAGAGIATPKRRAGACSQSIQ